MRGTLLGHSEKTGEQAGGYRPIVETGHSRPLDKLNSASGPTQSTRAKLFNLNGFRCYIAETPEPRSVLTQR